MQLYKKEMTEETALEIIGWEYPKPYDFYNMTLSNEIIKEMIEYRYNAVVDQQGTLIGFYCVGNAAQVTPARRYGVYLEDMVDIGFGMKPNFTGKGNGSLFLSYILSFINESFPGSNIRLSVATFNRRAIHLYEKFGFIKAEEFQTETADFITMVKRTREL